MNDAERWAVELHDTVCQELYALLMALRNVAPPLDADILAQAEKCLAEGRAIVARRMLEPRSTAAALAAFIAHDRVRSRLVLGPEPPPAIASAVAAIVTEALRNGLRHAAPGRVEVSGRIDSRAVEVAIADSGPGFLRDTLPSDRFGLTGMELHARAIGAELSIESAPSHGTRVRVSWRAEAEARPLVRRIERLLKQARRQASKTSYERAGEALDQAFALLDGLGKTRPAWLNAQLIATRLMVARLAGVAVPLPDQATLGRIRDGSVAGVVLVCAASALTAWSRESADEADRWLAAGDPAQLDDSDAAMSAKLAQRRAAGNILLTHGLHHLAMRSFDDSFRLAQRLGDTWEESIALYNLGAVCASLGDDAQAQALLERAAARKRGIGDAWGLAYTYYTLATVHARGGDLALARRRQQAMARWLAYVQDPMLRRLGGKLSGLL